MGERRKKFLIIFGGSLVLVTAFFLSWVVITQKSRAIYNFHSYEPSGFKALGELLAQEGYRMEFDDGIEPALEGESLLLVPPGSRITATLQQRLEQWVDGGGRVVEFSAARPQLIFPLTWENPVRIIPGADQRLQPLAPWLGDLTYQLSPATVYGVRRVDQGFYAVDDQFIIYRQNWGRGALLYWNDPDGLVNRRVAAHSDNGVIFAVILQSFTPSRTIRVWLPQGVAPAQRRAFLIGEFSPGRLAAVGLVILVALLIGWKMIVRFGRPQPLTLAKGRVADEFLHSLAGLFYQADAREWVIDHLWSALLQVMAEIAGSFDFTEADRLAERVEAITGKSNTVFHELHQERASRRYLHSKPEFLRLILQIENYRKALREW